MLLGLGASAVYSLMAAGVVLVYRGSGVINFAQGGFALIAGYAYFELHAVAPVWVAVVVAIGLAALCGLITQVALMWPMRHSSPLARIIATLGVLALITEAAQLRYGDRQRFVDGFLPTNSVTVAPTIILPADRLWLFLIATLLTVVLWAWSRYSRFGLATSAVGENQDAASALGWSPSLIAALNWMLGAALAGLAGVLLVPISSVSPDAFALTIVPALSAALVGNFSSFWLTLVGALIIGVLESESTRWIPAQGFNVAVSFAVILAILIFRGRALPVRSFLSDRLPAVGTGRIHVIGLVVAIVVTAGSLFIFPTSWTDAVTTTAIFAIVGLSLVVVTGYAGQISLAQLALAGMGALFGSRMAAVLGLPFPVALVVGVALTIPVGILVSLPALRARGVNLAVATLGLAVVMQTVILGNPDFTGGLMGTTIKPPTLFGLAVDTGDHPVRYSLVCLALLAVAALVVANIRRGRSGRRLLAVRDNERAAASVGVSVVAAKVYAFAVGAGIAALGGVLIAFRNPSVEFSQFSAFGSIMAVMLSVIGGLGYIAGAVVAGTIVAGGVVEDILLKFINLSGVWPLLLAAGLVIQIVLVPDGVAHQMARDIRRFAGRLAGKTRSIAAMRRDIPAIRVAPKTLELRNISVRFGGTLAVDKVTMTIKPGQVLGLIGPNGAGKTTLIDVATGFVRPTTGEVVLDGTDISRVPAQKRVGLGVARAWQSLELFSVMTVEENLRTAAEPGSFSAYVADLVWPREPPLPDIAQAVVQRFGLDEMLGANPDSLPYAARRLVGIARAVATMPSVLLLDEPAAGLDDRSTLELSDLIRDLAHEWGIAVLLVEHDVSMVMRTCDRVVAVEFGREIITGTPDEVRSHPRVIEAYLGTPEPGAPSGAAARVSA
jgi:sulfate-transporting ATPase